MTTRKFYETVWHITHTAQMTRHDIDIAIEKNRLALLSIVVCWLVFARLFRLRGAKPLPMRLSFFASIQLHKAEKAAYFLSLAQARMKGMGDHLSLVMPKAPEFGDQLTIMEIVARLRVLKIHLKQMRQNGDAKPLFQEIVGKDKLTYIPFNLVGEAFSTAVIRTRPVRTIPP